MDRLTEKITDKNTKEVLSYRIKCQKSFEAIQKLGKLEDLEEDGILITSIACDKVIRKLRKNTIRKQ